MVERMNADRGQRAARRLLGRGAPVVERDELRDQFWAAFDKFIPGVEGERAARQLAPPAHSHS